MAISGDTAIVGAIGAGDSGAVYVFVRNGSSWSQQDKMLGSDASHNNFGISVALAGDTAVIGASSTRGTSGAAFVYVRNGTTWSQQTKLIVDDAAADVDRLTSVPYQIKCMP